MSQTMDGRIEAGQPPGAARPPAPATRAEGLRGEVGPLPGFNARGRISQRTLIQIRWIGVAGQLVTLLGVRYGFGYELPLWPALAVVGVSALLNGAALFQGHARHRLGERDTALYLGYDMLQLAALLFLTGGLLNPFVILLLAPLTVSATLLSRQSTFALACLAILLLTVLALWHYPLPGLGRGILAAPYNAGTWLALTISTMFTAAYVWQVSADARQVSDALNATQMALAREQRVSALGALAAAAAHQLGTPLGTIKLIVDDLADDLPPGSTLTDDVAQLRREVDRCREILTELARRPEADDEDPFRRMTLPALVTAAAQPYIQPGISLDLLAEDGSADSVFLLRRTPELVHGLGNLIQNALQFARRRVVVDAEYTAEQVVLSVTDDGPGFPSALLGRLGEPYLSSRGEEGSHMGLGIFIAVALLENSGATLRFSNAPGGGATVAVCWPRARFETKGRM